SPRPDVGELDPFAFRSRYLVSREHLRLARLQDSAEHVLPRIDAQLGSRLRGHLPDEQADRILGASVGRAENMTAPPGGAELQLEPALLTCAEVERDRVPTVLDFETLR